MGVEPNYLEVMSLKWFLNIHISGVPIRFTPPQISIHIKEFVTPTGLEPVIFTVKGWCPNQLDDSAMSNQCCHRCMATSLICKFLSKYLTILVSSIFPWFSDGQTSESHSNSYQFSSWSNLLFALPQIPTPLSRSIQSSLIHFPTLCW